MKKTVTIGLDIGNSDVKTQNTIFPSGFAEYDSVPYGANNYIVYNGKCYVANTQRFSYEQDKTINENLIILSLLGIGKEIISIAEKCESRRKEPIGIQKEIDELEGIKLGIGLPPTHLSSLIAKTLDYYKARLKDTVRFNCNGYDVKFELEKIACYPQDFAALLTYNPSNKEDSAISYPTYYGIDLGGWTADVVTIENGEVQLDKCDSKPLGVLAMYDKIIREVEVTSGKRLTQNDVECVLKEEKTLLPEKLIVMIRQKADEWYKTIMSSLKQFGVDLEMYPAIFLGGGSQLFKKQIKGDTNIAKYEFINDPRANARAYATLIDLER